MSASAKARVQLTVEIDCGQGWGDECQMSQVYKQAVDSAKQNLMNALKPGEHGRIRIVGEAKIIAVIVEETR